MRALPDAQMVGNEQENTPESSLISQFLVEEPGDWAKIGLCFREFPCQNAPCHLKRLIGCSFAIPKNGLSTGYSNAGSNMTTREFAPLTARALHLVNSASFGSATTNGINQS